MKFFVVLITFLNICFAQISIPNTFEANFIQSVQNEENSTITYKGKLKATIDKKALWIYENPISKKIYFSNGEFLIIEDELEQAIYGKTNQNVDFFQILQNAKKTDQETYEAKCCDNKYSITLENEKIKSITYKDKLDNTIKLDFSNVLYNTPLDDGLFVPKIPKDYDLLRR